MEVIHATPCVPLTIVGPGGSTTVRCWLDTGGGYMFVDQSVIGPLQLQPGPNAHADDSSQPLKTVVPSRLAVGGRQIDPGDVPIAIAPAGFFDRVEAKAFLPARLLAAHDVVFDYPAATFTLAAPGEGRLDASHVPAAISSKSKFPRIEVTIGGTAYGMLLDTGASHTMLSDRVFDQLHARNPSWPVVDAALGTANMGSPAADHGRRMMRIPELRVGRAIVRDVSVVTRAAGIFEQYMSSTMSAPIVGALAGNVLQHLRIQLSYYRGAAAFAPGELTIPPAFTAPFSIARKADTYVIVDALATSGVRPGDELLAVDGRPVANTPFATVIAELTATSPGSRRVATRGSAGAETTAVTLVQI